MPPPLLKMLRPSGVLKRDFNVFASKTRGATGWLTRRQKLLPNRVKCDIELSETSHEWAASSKSTINAATCTCMPVLHCLQITVKCRVTYINPLTFGSTNYKSSTKGSGYNSKMVYKYCWSFFSQRNHMCSLFCL